MICLNLEWCDDWREELKKKHEKCYYRLCDCVNNKSDILTIAKLMYKYNTDKTKKESLDRTIDWICDWNNQIRLCPIEEEYNRILSKM